SGNSQRGRGRAGNTSNTQASRPNNATANVIGGASNGKPDSHASTGQSRSRSHAHPSSTCQDAGSQTPASDSGMITKENSGTSSRLTGTDSRLQPANSQPATAPVPSDNSTWVRN